MQMFVMNYYIGLKTSGAEDNKRKGQRHSHFCTWYANLLHWDDKERVLHSELCLLANHQAFSESFLLSSPLTKIRIYAYPHFLNPTSISDCHVNVNVTLKKGLWWEWQLQAFKPHVRKEIIFRDILVLGRVYREKLQRIAFIPLSTNSLYSEKSCHGFSEENACLAILLKLTARIITQLIKWRIQ